MTTHVKELGQSIESAEGGLFLEGMNRRWVDHYKAIQMIRDIMMYMDKTFVPETHKTPIYELGLNLWRDNIVCSSKIQMRLQSTLLDLVRQERNGVDIDRGLMRNIMKMLMDLGPSVYEDHFEKPFLGFSIDFYRVQS